MKFRTKYDEPIHLATNTTTLSATDASKQEETDIYALIKKYGIKSLMNKNQPEHELYIDTTIMPKNMTLQEAINLRNDFNEYFASAPAAFRKIFKDNPDNFLEAYRQGEYNQLFNAGALTKEQIELARKAQADELSDIRNTIYADVRKELEKEYKVEKIKDNTETA